MESMFDSYRVYSDRQRIVLLIDDKGTVFMSKVGKNEKFDLHKGMMAALTRSWLKWDHPNLDGEIFTVADQECYLGMLCSVTQKLEIGGPVFNLAHKWEVVDLVSNLSSLKVMTQFFPAD